MAQCIAVVGHMEEGPQYSYGPFDSYDEAEEDHPGRWDADHRNSYVIVDLRPVE